LALVDIRVALVLNVLNQVYWNSSR
jgi:hypothetical protein